MTNPNIILKDDLGDALRGVLARTEAHHVNNPTSNSESFLLGGLAAIFIQYGVPGGDDILPIIDRLRAVELRREAYGVDARDTDAEDSRAMGAFEPGSIPGAI